MAFLKQASLKIENPDVTIKNWVRENSSNIKTAANKNIEYKKIIADFSPEKYLLTHCTIVASVDVENAPKPVHFVSEKTKDQYKDLVGKSDYYITPETSKYMNANGDSWSRDLLLKTYKTFIGAENYVEHVQDPSLSKGKILDAVARKVDNNKSVFIDILVATNKKHTDLVEKIKTGKLQTLSMGAVVAFTICSQCGRVASDETELCSHIKFLKKNSFISENDGKKRITAELCGHFLYPESNKFIEGSWVEVPAFKGAVLRNEVDVNQVDKYGFEESIEPFIANLNIQDKELSKTASRIINAFKLVDSVKKSFTVDSKTDEEDLDIEEVKDVPVEDSSSEDLGEEESFSDDEENSEVDTEEDTSLDDDNVEEKSPADEGLEEDTSLEEIPEDLKEMGEPPIEDVVEEKEEPQDSLKEEILEEKSKKPYDEIKQDIKDQIKDQIKKELLRDLGIDVDLPKKTPSDLSNVNLNDTLVRSSLNKIRSACIMAKEVGLKNIVHHGYSYKEVIKIAELSNKYSINKEVFNAIQSLDSYKYPTDRRFAKEVEKKLGREISNKERLILNEIKKDFLD